MFKKLKDGLGGNNAKKKEEQKQKDRERIYRAQGIDVFEQNIKNTELGQMTVGIAVYRGPGVTPLPYEIAFARFLIPGKEYAANVATSYSYESFLSVLQEKINEIIIGTPLDTKNGTFEYVTMDGLDQRIVHDQVSFEVAINHLYHKRQKSEILSFTFKPGTDKAEKIRLPVEIPKAEFDIADAGANPKGLGMTLEAHSGSPKGLGIVLEGESSDFPQLQSPTSPKTLESAATHVSTETSHHRRRLSALSSSTSSQPSSPRSTHSALNSKSKEDRPKSKLSNTLSGVGSKIKKRVTGRETPAERCERLRSLWEEDDRTVFKKGGEDEAEEDNISTIAALEKDDDEDGAETEVEEEEDEDISQEDRAITK